MQPTARGKQFVRQALVVGVLLGIVDLVRTLIEGPSGLTAATPGSLGVMAFLIVAGGFVYLGFRVAAETARVGASALAGLIAGLVVWACYVVGTMIVALPNQEALRRRFQAAADQAHLGIHYTTAAVFAALTVSIVLAIFLGAGVGAGLAALGGMLGRRRAPRSGLLSRAAQRPLWAVPKRAEEGRRGPKRA